MTKLIITSNTLMKQNQTHTMDDYSQNQKNGRGLVTTLKKAIETEKQLEKAKAKNQAQNKTHKDIDEWLGLGFYFNDKSFLTPPSGTFFSRFMSVIKDSKNET